MKGRLYPIFHVYIFTSNNSSLNAGQKKAQIQIELPVDRNDCRQIGAW